MIFGKTTPTRCLERGARPETVIVTKSPTESDSPRQFLDISCGTLKYFYAAFGGALTRLD